jgi:hypothetical protein
MKTCSKPSQLRVIVFNCSNDVKMKKKNLLKLFFLSLLMISFKVEKRNNELNLKN